MNCTNCGIKKTENSGQWWNLHNYFKINGRFCPTCYNKVSHDGYERPKNPNDYLLILLKQTNPSS